VGIERYYYLILLLIPILISTLFIVPSYSQEFDEPVYLITGGEVNSFDIDYDVASLIIQLRTFSDGELTIELPRELIDAKKSNGYDDVFFVLVNGFETPFEQTTKSAAQRTIIVSFPKGTDDIEIIGTVVSGQIGSGYPLTISVDKSSYLRGETISISGKVKESQGFLVKVKIYLITPDNIIAISSSLDVKADRTFSTSIMAGVGGMYNNEGTFTVEAYYGEDTKPAKTMFEYIDIQKPKTDTKIETTEEPSQSMEGDHIEMCELWHEQYALTSKEQFLRIQSSPLARDCVKLYENEIWDYIGSDRTAKLIEKYNELRESSMELGTEQREQSAIEAQLSQTTLSDQLLQERVTELEQKIRDFEEQLADKDAILMEQIKVIMDLVNRLTNTVYEKFTSLLHF